MLTAYKPAGETYARSAFYDWTNIAAIQCYKKNVVDCTTLPAEFDSADLTSADGYGFGISGYYFSSANNRTTNYYLTCRMKLHDTTLSWFNTYYYNGTTIWDSSEFQFNSTDCTYTYIAFA